MADIIDFKQPPAAIAPTIHVSDDDFGVIVAGLRSLPPATRVSAITKACDYGDLRILVAIVAGLLGPEILEDVCFGLTSREK